MGIREALSWLKRKGLNQVIVEINAKFVVDNIHYSAGSSAFHLIIDDCKLLLSEFDNIQLRYVNRFANSVAHLLARRSGSVSDMVEL